MITPQTAKAIRAVIVDSEEIAARGQILFPGALVVHANGKIPAEALGFPDAIVPSADRRRIDELCSALVASGCPSVREWEIDLSTVTTRQEILDAADDIKPYVPSESRATSEPRNSKPHEAIGQEGTQVLDAVYSYIGKFVSYPSDYARIAHTLWLAHTHSMDSWESTPRIAFLSAEPGSGKTRALEISETLVPRPVESINASPAYIFRRVSAAEGPPTILFDEIDTIFGPKAKENEELRGIINAGHRRGAMAGRCVVKRNVVETEELPAYCAVAIAGLGALPDTILSRSIVVRMRRRAPGEAIKAFRRRIHAPEGNKIRARLEAWAKTVGEEMRQAWPIMPPGVEDRDADVWEALLAVADAAGGEWPGRARAAAVALVADSKGSTPSLGIRLLTDLRDIFGGREAMGSEKIIKALVAMDEAPWSDLRGKPIDSRRLGSLLRPYGVTSRNIRLGNGVVKGYARENLHDPWSRYLGPPPAESATSATGTTDALGPSEDEEPVA